MATFRRIVKLCMRLPQPATAEFIYWLDYLDRLWASPFDQLSPPADTADITESEIRDLLEDISDYREHRERAHALDYVGSHGLTVRLNNNDPTQVFVEAKDMCDVDALAVVLRKVLKKHNVSDKFTILYLELSESGGFFDYELHAIQVNQEEIWHRDMKQIQYLVHEAMDLD